MFKSVRQFLEAVFLKPKVKDLDHFNSYLNIGERALFERIPKYEKVHAILSAKKVKKLIHEKPHIDERKMIRATLLHDIGRITGKIGLFDKVWLKLMKYFLKPIYNKLAERGRNPGSKMRKFYIHKHHGELAIEFLERAGTENDVIELVVKHAEKPRKTDPEELKILRKADRTS